MLGAVKPLAQVLAGATDTVLYTGLPGSTAPVITYVTSLWVANIDTVQRAFTLHFWLTGSLTSSNALTEAQAIPGNVTFYYNFHKYGLPIPTGYTLYGKGDVASKIVFTLFGSEQV